MLIPARLSFLLRLDSQSVTRVGYSVSGTEIARPPFRALSHGPALLLFPATRFEPVQLARTATPEMAKGKTQSFNRKYYNCLCLISGSVQCSTSSIGSRLVTVFSYQNAAPTIVSSHIHSN